MKDFSIQLQGIKKAYNRPVLNNIDLEITKDFSISLIGKSGSGKSTLMHILGLVESFDEGEYFFAGTKIQNNKDYAQLRLEKIGFVFQNYNLIPTLTCQENILLPTLYHKSPRRYLSELAKGLDIEHLLDTSVNVLSGGEKQRVAIARALILHPEIIIADEPTGNLDKGNTKIVVDLLFQAHKEGCALVLISHDFSIASLADRVLELRDGKLYEH